MMAALARVTSQCNSHRTSILRRTWASGCDSRSALTIRCSSSVKAMGNQAIRGSPCRDNRCVPLRIKVVHHQELNRQWLIQGRAEYKLIRFTYTTHTASCATDHLVSTYTTKTQSFHQPVKRISAPPMRPYRSTVLPVNEIAD